MGKYKTKKDVLKRAQEAIGIRLGEIDKTNRLATGKGGIGNMLEESWFGYAPNSSSEPDFPEAKVELKVTPYIQSRFGISAKERLVCNIINYMTEYKKSFKTSDFWHKCETMLIMSYEHQDGVPKTEYTIDKAVLFSFPEEDRLIIENDWNIIINKIKSGEAHLLTEGDTMYLAACTKGRNAEDVRPQPFSNIPAKQRAYSLKSSYMTHVLNSYIFGTNEDEHIIKDWRTLVKKPFENVVIERLQPFYGRTVSYLTNAFGLNPRAKDLNDRILSKMLGIEGHASQTSEFKNASIVAKTIRIQRNGHIKESMSFPAFRFTEIIKENWETSDLKNYLEPARFMFVIFRENAMGDYVFDHVKFWNIPAEDLMEVETVWNRTVEIIKQGVKLNYDGRVVHNNLPKSTENRVAHVRPHARDSTDVFPLPDGREMPKQSFWFNRKYIESIVLDKTETERYQITDDYLNVAEDKTY